MTALVPGPLPLLQAATPDDGIVSALATGGGIVVLLALVIGAALLFVTRYKRCPANRILVLSGKVGGEGSSRCISGGGAFVWPVIQEYAFLDLSPLTIQVALKDALSLENIRIAVPSVFTVAIGNHEPYMRNAATRLLGLEMNDLQRLANDVIVGQMRAVIATLSIEQINRSRDEFRSKIESALAPELQKLGLMLLNVNIADLRDESGYLEAIGKKATSEAKQRALGEVAETEREGAIKVAAAERDKAVGVAGAARDREIGTQTAEQEQAVALSNLARDTEVKRAEAERTKQVRLAEITRETQVAQKAAAFQQEAEISERDMEKRVRTANAEAQATSGESEAQARRVAAQATLRLAETEARERTETATARANAAVAQASAEAQTEVANARSAQVEAERRAELEAPARAEKAQRIVLAEADAEAMRIQATAEANATRTRAEAEAAGEYARLSKRAEALGELITRAGGAQQAFGLLLADQLPRLTEIAAEAMKSIHVDKVIVWDGGGASGQTGEALPSFVKGLVKTGIPAFDLIEAMTGVKLPRVTPEVPVSQDGVHASTTVSKQ